jgi:hypothetical protein
VDIGAAPAIFLGRRHQWSERGGFQSASAMLVACLGGGGAIYFSSPVCIWFGSGSASCKRRSSVSVCARALVSFIGLECSHLWLLCFNCCHVLVELYQYKLYHFLISNMQGTILKKII